MVSCVLFGSVQSRVFIQVFSCYSPTNVIIVQMGVLQLATSYVWWQVCLIALSLILKSSSQLFSFIWKEVEGAYNVLLYRTIWIINLQFVSLSCFCCFFLFVPYATVRSTVSYQRATPARHNIMERRHLPDGREGPRGSKRGITVVTPLQV